jgi:hypothetical protein
MGKRTNSIVGALSALAISLGCSSAVDSPINARQMKNISHDKNWFRRDSRQVYEQGNMIYAIGISTSANPSLARMSAESDARQKLAKHLSGQDSYQVNLRKSQVYSFNDSSGETRCLVGMPRQ